MKDTVIPESFGPLFDTITILEDEHEGGRRTFPNEMDGYFYATIPSELRDTNGTSSGYIPFK